MSQKERYFIRVDPIFRKELMEIKIKKIQNGTSDRMIGDRRITKAIRRMDIWKEMKNRLILAKMEDDRGIKDG